MSHAKPVVINFIDMDDTITKTIEYYHLLAQDAVMEGKTPPPPELFINGALEFIKARKEAGEKVALVSHSYRGFHPLVETALKEMGVTLDACITLEDFFADEHSLYKCAPLKSRDEKILRGLDPHIPADQFDKFIGKLKKDFGKSGSAYMAIVALKKMGFTAQSNGCYTGIIARTIGDEAADLIFSSHIRLIGIPCDPFLFRPDKDDMTPRDVYIYEGAEKAEMQLKARHIKVTPFYSFDMLPELLAPAKATAHNGVHASTKAGAWHSILGASPGSRAASRRQRRGAEDARASGFFQHRLSELSTRGR